MDVKAKLKEVKQKASEMADNAWRATKRYYYDHREDFQKLGPVIGAGLPCIHKECVQGSQESQREERS